MPLSIYKTLRLQQASKIIICLLCSSLLSVKAIYAQLHVIPQPVSIVNLKGSFTLTNQDIIAVDKETEAVGNYLQQYLYTSYKLNLKVKVYTHIPLHAAIKLLSRPESIDGVGAYSLFVSPKNIAISGNGAGLFYGVQSLLQLLPGVNAKSLIISACKIEDHPRFKWRGLSLDVSRHFFTVDEVKKYIDLMAHYKLNIFHWHLVDDEGWRIQIDKYPLLTEVGSKMAYWEQQGKFRKLDNLIGGGRDGFYTKDDIREVVKYAKDRFITILPEIEMPGHSEAAIFAYPELGYKDSTGAKHRVRMLDPSEYTFKFYENVLTEVMELFPNQYIHIGGDEAEMSDWLKSPTAVALMKKEHLKNDREIQSYFIKRIETFLISKNKKLIGWDEILAGGLAPSATVMSWQGEEGGIAAARMHHDVVMTPLPQMYFDAPQGKASTEPPGWNDPVNWQMVYSYEPLPAVLTDEEDKYILGAQANIWTERIPNLQHLEYMVYPRVLAVAELTWTPRADKNIERFEQSMYTQYRLFNLWNINSRLPNINGLQDITTNKDQVSLMLTYPLKNAQVQYALNTKLPDTVVAAKLFPVIIKTPVKDSVLISAYVTQKTNRQHHVWQTATLRHVNLNPAAIKADTLKPDLAFRVYKTTLTNYTKLDTVKTFTTGILNRDYSITPFMGIFNTWVKLTGYLKIDTEGDYQVYSDYEISPLIYLDKSIVIYRDNNKYVEPQTAILHLKKGFYQLTGYYLANNENRRQMPLSLKTFDGKIIELSTHLFH